ncbi:MAG: ADP-ribosylglycohydrolase family protein, partial [Acidimicrobiales bacterium]
MSDPSWVDRVAGVALGGAVGDALGAGYEFQDRPGPEIDMIGGGPFRVAPGEWTDDTAMANAVLRVAATGEWRPEAIGAGFLEWFAGGPKDVGNQTRAVLGAARTPDRLQAASAEHFARNPRGSAGNGSLMRTGPVALAHLGDDAAIAEAARTVSDLTHADPLAGDACVLWCIAIDRAVREARLDGIDDGLALLPAERRAQWEGWLGEARTQPPRTFTPNGYVVTALQAALAAIHHTPVPAEAPGRHLVDSLIAAVRIGNDTDTVAAIAGALLGARWGGSAVPLRWRALLHGWPGWDATHLAELAILAAQNGQPDPHGWPGVDSVLP